MHFHPYADFYAALADLELEGAGHFAHPVRAHASGGKDDRAGGNVAFGRAHAADAPLFRQHPDRFAAGENGDALFLKPLAHAVDVAGQKVAAQVLLLDEEQIDADPLGFSADFPGAFHVRGKNRAVHAEAVEDAFCFVNQGLGVGNAQELGQVGFAEFVDKVQLAVGKKPGPAHAGKNVAGVAVGAFAGAAHGAAAFFRPLSAFEQDHG